MNLNRPASLPGVALAFFAGAATAAPVMFPGPPAHDPHAIVGMALVFDDRVTETLDLPTWELQQARRRMLADESISWDEMRALADHGDGLAAFRFARRIEEGGDPELLPEAAFYYATAAYTNRDYAVRPLVRILQRRDLEIGARRLEHMENALRAMALAGDVGAKEALSGFYASGHPFGPQPERALEFRLDLAEAGDADAAMALVLEALSGSSSVPLDEAQIARLFELVAASNDLGQRTTGENLRRMYDSGSIQVGPAIRPAPAPVPAAEEAAP